MESLDLRTSFCKYGPRSATLRKSQIHDWPLLFLVMDRRNIYMDNISPWIISNNLLLTCGIKRLNIVIWQCISFKGNWNESTQQKQSDLKHLKKKKIPTISLLFKYNYSVCFSSSLIFYIKKKYLNFIANFGYSLQKGNEGSLH
jgi:hypothetical protein